MTDALIRKVGFNFGKPTSHSTLVTVALFYVINLSTFYDNFDSLVREKVRNENLLTIG